MESKLDHYLDVLDSYFIFIGKAGNRIDFTVFHLHKSFPAKRILLKKKHCLMHYFFLLSDAAIFSQYLCIN